MGPPPKMGVTCSLCQHEDAENLNIDITMGRTNTYIAAKYGKHPDSPFTAKNVHMHIKRCLQTSWRKIREDRRIHLTSDVDDRFARLLDEAEEAYYAAKTVLLVDGELDFSPRAWEINVVYLDHNDLNQQTLEPKLKSASLSQLLAKLTEAGYEPQHSYIKA
jgi:hypothetical protein